MQALRFLVDSIAGLIFWLVLIQVILSWMLSLNVINFHNPFVRQLYSGLSRLIEPLLTPIRRFLPNTGGFDLSPVILLIGVEFLRILIGELFFN